MIRFNIALCISVLVCGQVAAELPHIRLDRIFPLGGSAGGEAQLEIVGRDLDDVKELRFDHPGLKAQWLKANHFKVIVDAAVPTGTYEVRAVGRFGISGARLFAVSHGLAGVREVEPNDSPEKAQAVPINVAIDGSSDGNGDDFYRFTAKKGERLTIDCQAIRLDSTLRALLSIASADGKELQQSRPYHLRTDPLLDFSAPADGDYLVRLHDATFSGGLPYRLVISNRPHIENAFPAAVVPGEKTDLLVLGRNLPGGRPAPTASVQDRPLDQLVVPFVAPRGAAVEQRFTFATHLASPSLNARGLQFWPETIKDALNPVTLAFADAPVTLEHEPNDTKETAQSIVLPTVVCGRFDRPGDSDWYTFKAKAGAAFTVDLLCERLDFPGDPFVIIFDSKGNELATFDDHGTNFNSLAQYNRDPLGTFRVPADGEYRIFVQEGYQQGGARYQYVLRLANATPDFYPVVFHVTPSDPTCPVVGRGGSAFYEACLNRRDFGGPVTIEADGLPPGLSCPPVLVSPQGQFANVVFTATADAPEWAGAIRLKAWALVDGKRIEREVRCSQRRWAIDNINTSVALREICLSIRGQAPYAVKLPQKLTVTAGGALDVETTAARLWPEFQGKVQLIGLNLPPGFSAPTVDIAPNKTSVIVKLAVAGNVPAGDYSVVLRGDAQVPYSRDAKMARTNTRVADPSTALIVTVNAKK